MAYADGFLITMPRKNIGKYKKMATLASKVWIEHGALEYFECTLEDDKVQGVIPFTTPARARKGDTVVLAWIVFKSRAHRDAVNKKVMQDKRMQAPMEKDMPFDVKKMVYSGFDVLVQKQKR